LHRPVGRHLALFYARVLPKLASNFDGIDAGCLPPGPLVTGAMRGPMMHPAERDREFVARLAAERPWLQVAQMMGVGRLAPADEAGLLNDKAQVLAIAIAAWGGNRERALVEAVGVIPTGETPGVHSFTMPQVVHTVLFA